MVSSRAAIIFAPHCHSPHEQLPMTFKREMANDGRTFSYSCSTRLACSNLGDKHIKSRVPCLMRSFKRSVTKRIDHMKPGQPEQPTLRGFLAARKQGNGQGLQFFCADQSAGFASSRPRLDRFGSRSDSQLTPSAALGTISHVLERVRNPRSRHPCA